MAKNLSSGLKSATIREKEKVQVQSFIDEPLPDSFQDKIMQKVREMGYEDQDDEESSEPET